MNTKITIHRAFNFFYFYVKSLTLMYEAKQHNLTITWQLSPPTKTWNQNIPALQSAGRVVKHVLAGNKGNVIIVGIIFIPKLTLIILVLLLLSNFCQLFIWHVITPLNLAEEYYEAFLLGLTADVNWSWRNTIRLGFYWWSALCPTIILWGWFDFNIQKTTWKSIIKPIWCHWEYVLVRDRTCDVLESVTAH